MCRPVSICLEVKLLPHVVIADEAFPLRTYWMRPYSRDKVQGDEDKKLFNYRLSRARNVSENAFVLLVRKFRNFERSLWMSHDHVDSVTLAACCLHSYLRNKTCRLTERDWKVSVSDMRGLENLEWIGENSLSYALEVSDGFTDYFNTDAGSVRWQHNKAKRGKKCSCSGSSLYPQEEGLGSNTRERVIFKGCKHKEIKKIPFSMQSSSPAGATNQSIFVYIKKLAKL